MKQVFVTINRLATDGFQEDPGRHLSRRPRSDLTTTDRQPITLNISLAYLGLYDIPE